MKKKRGMLLGRDVFPFTPLCELLVVRLKVAVRTKHAHRLSFSLEVGSSFDSDLEDVSAWESEPRA
ncbi:hypothetical protein SCLCIDRAFT_563122 [Scleroderma citrinum Foug A]|uniref:Uncharacterized protein n=1 Tax=Scleroderma citrinum Foug A TaxID=1036808 RepID=A0A0C2ZUG1_9AGAM|nr:hypothetical protein SCLCIDRAFT_563122 [Scleroderma citrinum Foug A]